MAIPFTYRELRNANLLTYKGWSATSKTNAHRLLLFYSVECGLKAIYLKRLNLDLFDSNTVSEKMFSHDINHLLDELKAGRALRLKSHFELPPYKKNGQSIRRRHLTSELNQAWRYGGTLIDPENDEVFEQQLCKISDWIKGELR